LIVKIQIKFKLHSSIRCSLAADRLFPLVTCQAIWPPKPCKMEPVCQPC